MSYTFEIIRSGRRTLSLEITRELKLLVRAPNKCPSSYISSFVESHADWIETHMEKQRLRTEARPALTEDEISALILRAKSELPPLVSHYAEIMGLSPTGITITGAQRRFGSCSPKNRLCFSYRLMLYPQPAIEYVVVHELAHIVHKNHGSNFYALIGSVMPDYKQRDKLLKK